MAKGQNRKNTVIVDFEIEGFHHYPDAPENVDFLKNNHRHLFQIRAGFKVSKTNREKEIFTVEGEIKNYLNEAFGYPCVFEAMSCEDIANEILDFSQEDGCIWVEVFEDGKGGAKAEL